MWSQIILMGWSFHTCDVEFLGEILPQGWSRCRSYSFNLIGGMLCCEVFLACCMSDSNTTMDGIWPTRVTVTRLQACSIFFFLHALASPRSWFAWANYTFLCQTTHTRFLNDQVLWCWHWLVAPYFRWLSQMAERWGSWARNQKVANRFPAVSNDVVTLGKALHLICRGGNVPVLTVSRSG